MQALERAIQRAGTVAALARGIGEQPQKVSAWLRRAKGKVPAEYCPAIEEMTGVTCEELRPDVRWYVLRGSRTSEARHG